MPERAAFAGVGIEALVARDLVAGGKGEREYVADLLERQVDLLHALAEVGEGPVFDLRFLTREASATGGPRELEVGILVRCVSNTQRAAQGEANRLAVELHRLITASFSEYDARLLLSDEVEALRDPFGGSAMHVAEVARRHDEIAVGRPFPRRRRERQPGFHVEEATQGEDDLADLYYVFPFLPRMNGLRRMAGSLLLRPEATLVSVRIAPTVLRADEEQALEALLEQCETYLQGIEGVKPPTLVAPVMSAPLTRLRNGVAGQLEALLDAVLMVRIQVASPVPVERLLLRSIGVELSRSFDPEGFAGGFDLPVSTGAKGSAVALREAVVEMAPADIAPAALGRWRQLFSPREAVAAFRLPTSDGADFPGMVHRFHRTVAAPLAPRKVVAPSGTLGLGVNRHRGVELPVALDPAVRRRHCYVVGMTGVGKSTLLEEMILQDIAAGRGVCVLDPHGDLVEAVAARVPVERIEDVIYLDPADRGFPVGVNMLECRSEEERYHLIQELLAIFEKQFGKDPSIVGPIFQSTLTHALKLLTANPADPGTLADVGRVLADKRAHERWLPFVKNPESRHYWEKVFPSLNMFHENGIGYFTSKVEQFVNDPLLRNIFCQPRSTIDFRAVFDQQKVMLVDLCKGRLGERNAAFLGMILVGKLQVAALSRADLPAEERSDFFLYADEFQNVATDNFRTLLSEARKFGLCLVIANQFLGQLDDGMRAAVLGNVGTLIAFRVGAEDARLLDDVFAPSLGQRDLMALPYWNAYVSTLAGQQVLAPFSLATRKGTGVVEDGQLAQIRKGSRRQYAKPRAYVESLLASKWWREDENKA